MKASRGRSLRRPASLVLPLLALLAWVLLLFFAHRAGAFMAGTSVRYGEEQGLSPAGLSREERYAREDGRESLPKRTLWREDKAQTLSDETAFRSVPVSLLTCFGSGDDLYPAPFRFGAMPVRGDNEGIALSVAAADALWGGVGSAGQTVRLGDKTYFLRGVFEGDSPLAVVQDGEDSEKSYPNLLIQMDKDAGAQDIQMYINGGAALDLPFLSVLLTALAFLPGLILLAALLCRLLGRGWRLRYSPILLAQYVLPALALGALSLVAAGFPWDIPAKLIPTRFSDLDFWGKLAGEIGGGIVGVVTGAMTHRDLALWTPVLCLLLLLPVACALTLAALPRVEAASLNALLVGGLISMGLTYAMALWLGINLSYTVLALPVLYLAADLALYTHEKSLKPKAERRSDDEAARQAALGD